MASLEPELQNYYDRYFELFSSEGWEQLIGELKHNASLINSVENTKDVDDMYFRKGQLNILSHLINFDSLIDNSYDELTQEPEDV